MKSEINQVREEIRRLSTEIISLSGSEISQPLLINDKEFVTAGNNCSIIECSLSKHGKDMTVANVVMEKGAFIPPHTHDRIETIFCVDGEYTDVVSGKKYTRGMTQHINSFDLHGASSDYALLIITWQPSFEKPYK